MNKEKKKEIIRFVSLMLFFGCGIIVGFCLDTIETARDCMEACNEYVNETCPDYILNPFTYDNKEVYEVNISGLHKQMD